MYFKFGLLCLALLASVSLAQAATPEEQINEIKRQADRTCVRLQPRVNSALFSLSSANELMSISRERAELKTDIASTTDSVKARLDSWCATMRTSPPATLEAVSALADQLNEIKVEENFLPTFGLLESFDAILGDFVELKSAVGDATSGGIVKDKNDFAGGVAGAAADAAVEARINQAVSDAQTKLGEAQSALPPDELFRQAPAQSAAASAETQRTIDSKIKAVKSAVAAGRAHVKKARADLDAKLERAALESVSPSGKSAAYQAAYAAARERVAQAKRGAIRSVESRIRGLGRLKGLVEQASLLSEGTRGDLVADASYRLGVLTSIKSALEAAGADTRYSAITAQERRVAELKLDVIVPAINDMLEWEGALEILNGQTTANASLESGLRDFVAIMQNEQKKAAIAAALGAARMAPLTQQLAAINLNQFNDQLIVTQAQAVFNPTDAEGSAGKTMITSGSSAERDAILVHELARLIDDFQKTLGPERKKVERARKDWLALVKEAASSGKITDLAPFVDDIRAQKIFDEFNERRETFYAQAGRLVGLRKGAIAKNAERIAARTAIPQAARIGNNLADFTSAVVSQLDAHETAMRATADYLALREKVRDITTLGVNTVFIPAQRLYLDADKFFTRQAVLRVISGALITRAQALPGSHASRDTLVQQAQAVDTRISNVGTQLSAALIGPLNQALALRASAQTAADVTAAEEQLDAAAAAIGAARKELGTLRRDVSSLLRSIQQAEKTP
ncbi:MAG: hypothetical protein HY462_01015 [Parcubacteria group bacterium]|nr:hypothetical protein [Parcubacteria group bacterium]